MALHFHWFLPTNGDGHDIVGGGHGVATGSAGAIRPASLGYLGQVARSAEQIGFDTVRARVRSRSLGRCVVTRYRAERRRYHVPARARAHLDRRQTPCESR
jgi:hypothetical protein